MATHALVALVCDDAALLASADEPDEVCWWERAAALLLRALGEGAVAATTEVFYNITTFVSEGDTRALFSLRHHFQPVFVVVARLAVFFEEKEENKTGDFKNSRKRERERERESARSPRRWTRSWPRASEHAPRPAGDESFRPSRRPVSI